MYSLKIFLLLILITPTATTRCINSRSTASQLLFLYNQQGNYQQQTERDQLNYLEEQAAANAALKAKAAAQGFKFNEGGPVPMPRWKFKEGYSER